MADIGTPGSWRAHAKLTVTLKMTGLRDDGFHLIDAEMVSLDLHDVLTFDPSRSGLSATGPFSNGVPTDDSNLVARALGLRAGIDVARGPEENAFYIIVGSAWR